jgi:hypothetical protein
MPDGNAPTVVLELYQVDSNGIAGFGPTLQEITRLGLDELRYVKGANRGKVGQARCLHYVETELEAIEKIQDIEGLQGSEMTLVSTSTEKEWLIFLLEVDAFYRPVVSTDPLKNFLITIVLTNQRTK